MDRFEARGWDDGHDRVAEQAANGVKKILIVSQDPATLDQVASALTQQFEIQLTCVSDSTFALKLEVAELHDLVVLDVDGIEHIASVLGPIENARPAVICVCGENRLAALVQAAQGASHTILLKPVSSGELIDAAQKVLRDREQAHLLATKYRNMRQLVRRVVRERRDLNRRVELVCRDLVEAHRRLTYRFVELQKTQANHP